MKITKKARSEAKRLFLACMGEEGLDPEQVREAARELVELKPRGYLPVLAHFYRLVKLEIERRTAQVESAIPLEEPVRANVTAQLERLFGKGLTFEFATEPALIGGLRIKVGSHVLDGSVQARLTALKESF